MAFLYECGHCGAFYQTKVAFLSTSKHQLTCANCKKNNVFGQPLPDSIHEPVIEQVAPDKLSDFIPSNHSIPVVDIGWTCGVCESMYQFNSSSISEHGSKITCQTCFNFIVLRHIGPMDDLDYIQTQDISQETPRDVTPSHQPEIQDVVTADTLFEETSLIGQHEHIDVSENQEHRVETFVSHPEDEASHQPMIQSGYADPRNNKRDVVYPKNIPETTKAPIKGQESATDIQTSHSIDIQEAMLQETTIPSPALDPQPKPVVETQSEAVVETQSEPVVSTKKEDPIPPPQPETDPAEAAKLQQAYLAPDESFIAYQDFKANDTFTYNFKEDEIKEVNPEDQLPKVVQKVEKNMIKVSLIFSAVLVVLLAVFLMYQQSKKDEQAIQQRIEAEKRLKEIEKDSSNSKYGFPEIQEME